MYTNAIKRPLKKKIKIREFVRCHPMPLPDDEEEERFWKNVINR